MENIDFDAGMETKHPNPAEVIGGPDEDDVELVSNCCCAPVYENTDICTACKEHCEEVKLGEDDD